MPSEDIPPLPPDILALMNKPLIGQEEVNTYPFSLQGDTIFYKLAASQQAQPVFTSDLGPDTMRDTCRLLSKTWKMGWELCSQIATYTMLNPSASVAHYLEILAQAQLAEATAAQDNQGEGDEQSPENKSN